MLCKCCNGKGKVQVPSRDLVRPIVEYEDCKICDGFGHIPHPTKHFK